MYHVLLITGQQKIEREKKQGVRGDQGSGRITSTNPTNDIRYIVRTAYVEADLDLRPSGK